MGCEFYIGKKQTGKITQLQRQTIFVKKKKGRSHRIEPRVENNGQRINSLGLRVSHQETFLALRIEKPGNMYLDFRISWADDCCVCLSLFECQSLLLCPISPLHVVLKILSLFFHRFLDQEES